MSTTVDANILVYASNTADPMHLPAVDLVRRLAEGPEIVYLFWPTLMGYLRIVTEPAILPRPLAPAQAMRKVSTFFPPSPGSSITKLCLSWPSMTVFMRRMIM